MTNQPYVFQAWPSYRYGPNGEAEIFQSEDEVPEGWLDHPSKFDAPESVEDKVDEKTPKPRAPRKPKEPTKAELAATLAAAKADRVDDLDDLTDEQLAAILLDYGLASDGAARETIIAVIRDERAKG